MRALLKLQTLWPRRSSSAGRMPPRASHPLEGQAPVSSPAQQNGLRARACSKHSFASSRPFAPPCDSKASYGRDRPVAEACGCSSSARGAQQRKAHSDVGRLWVHTGSLVGPLYKTDQPRLRLAVGPHVGPSFQIQCEHAASRRLRLGTVVVVPQLARRNPHLVLPPRKSVQRRPPAAKDNKRRPTPPQPRALAAYASNCRN